MSSRPKIRTVDCAKIMGAAAHRLEVVRSRPVQAHIFLPVRDRRQVIPPVIRQFKELLSAEREPTHFMFWPYKYVIIAIKIKSKPIKIKTIL